jgi:putative ABC transport system permease protein
MQEESTVTDQNAESTKEKNNIEPVSLEKLITQNTRTFTVVGICNRLSFELEQYNAAGYTVITTFNQDNINNTDQFNAYIKTKKPKGIYKIIERYANNQNENSGYSLNYELLRTLGASDEDSFNKVFYSLGSILIALIMVGSISLIYNSFAISVSERKKQFGLLSSTGATARQRKNSVLFEAFVIASIGIPIGILSGIAGIGTTLYLLKDIMTSFINSEVPLELTLSVSVSAVVIAVIVALATILLSAYIPAKRSKKISPMDAIRQSSDIKLTAKQVKTSKLSRKLFGLEGDLALKNLKRNRRRYRSTVISLFISVVLFISASSFAMYLKNGVTNVYENTEYDLSVYADLNNYDENALKNIYHQILDLNGITQGSFVMNTNGTVKLKKEQVKDEYFKQITEQAAAGSDDTVNVGMIIYSIDHDNFKAYIQNLGLDENEIGPEQAAGIIIDRQHYYNPKEERYSNTSILKNESLQSLDLTWQTEDGTEKEMKITATAYADTAPFGIADFAYGNYMMLIIDEEQRANGFATLSDGWNSSDMYFSAKDPMKSEKDIQSILLQAGMPISNLYNEAEALQDNRNIITIISVFAYGFITLISLITIANVFNTISTNVNLRRREFAMLKSVGMTNRGFNKMLNYECIFYGLKALLYGLPVSIGVTYLIYLSVENGVDLAFYVPIQSILISIFSVFLVVFISMMYSMRKIRRENVLDALKNENL